MALRRVRVVRMGQQASPLISAVSSFADRRGSARVASWPSVASATTSLPSAPESRGRLDWLGLPKPPGAALVRHRVTTLGAAPPLEDEVVALGEQVLQTQVSLLTKQYHPTHW